MGLLRRQLGYDAGHLFPEGLGVVGRVDRGTGGWQRGLRGGGSGPRFGRWRFAAGGVMMGGAGRVGGGLWEGTMLAASHRGPRLRGLRWRRGISAAALAAVLMTSGCMTTMYLATDYNERTEKQWWTAFLTDIAIGGALIGTAFAVGEDGEPQWWVLSAGAASAGFGLLVMPLALPPRPLPAVRPQRPAGRGGSSESGTRRSQKRPKPAGASEASGAGASGGRKARPRDEAQ